MSGVCSKATVSETITTAPTIT